MNDLDTLLEAYAELERLSESALASMHGGLDLAVLNPIFERKAALSAVIQSVKPEALETGEGLQALLQAQKKASQAEAALIQALQPWISSVVKMEESGRLKPAPETGQRWDLSG